MSLLPFLLTLYSVAPFSIPFTIEQELEYLSAQPLELSAPDSFSRDLITQTTAPEIIPYIQEVRPLPGELDDVPVFNSNSPELIENDGILLSTFPTRGKADPEAHLDYAFEGRFDIFDHHVVRARDDSDTRTRYLGIVVHNPSNRPVTLRFREAASYLSQEAPWYGRNDVEFNLASNQFSGPGSRLMNDILRDRRQLFWPDQITISPRETHLLLNAPLPVRSLSVATDGSLTEDDELLPPLPKSLRGDRSNARSTLLRLSSDGPVYVASLTMLAPLTAGGERVPSLAEWLQILINGSLATPRDLKPTQPGRQADRFIYGRVAGVSQGSRWQARLTDRGSSQLAIPPKGQQISYAISTVDHNTFGTGQIQSAPMLRRYSDTAYRAHGNYGTEYDLTLPLYNPTDQPKTIALSIQTPLQNENLKNALTFLTPHGSRIFFRGTVLFLYTNDQGERRADYIHLVQRRGQIGPPLIELTLAPGEERFMEVQFLYPPDATPPQVLTLTTYENN
ncbi:hypothetical protein N836_08135 [Leptolyngbya sp. Heron Island J]|uniref:DUF3370 domain-containing protein n=1 Tax=Leptolyngbya sp. Heron Island J TaxID=1385935 RepID=UPI0003B9628A|nr:DUF3370 domain-containing protein [Leptolyngbya sp. Heron Island J]ESA36301.1 hypothetical protein N836_08135 [Leptolyngbya sp. Heron Island J]